MTDRMTAKIALHSASEGADVFGPQDRYLQLIEQHCGLPIVIRDAHIVVQGTDNTVLVDQMRQLFQVLVELVRNGYVLTERDIAYAIELSKTFQTEELLDLYKGEITSTFKGKPIRVKTIGQRHYVSTIKKKDIVFGIGPAGTGTVSYTHLTLPTTSRV